MATRRRHIPLRSCVICGNKTSKRELIRIVAAPQGDVDVDSTGKANGRGAYICKSGTCAPDGLKRGRLDHALRTKISDDSWERLTSSLQRMRSANTI